MASSYVQRPAVDGEHAGGLADADGVFTGEHIVDIARQRGDVGDAADVLLAVQDGLIQVGDAPTLGDIEAERLRQLRPPPAPVMVFCQVRNGASRFQSLSKAR